LFAGGVLNQDYKEAQYAVYSYLNYSSVGFVLTVANPNQLRSYVCEIQGKHTVQKFYSGRIVSILLFLKKGQIDCRFVISMLYLIILDAA